MMDSDHLSKVRQVEGLLWKQFVTEPFHNLARQFRDPVFARLPGGTCSDKTLSFIASATEAGVDVALHTGFIRGQEVHRLARVSIQGRIYFADVGNGWPAIKLYPADRPITFSCFGMTFRTEIMDGWLSVFHERLGKESLQLEVNLTPRPEIEIRADIESRYTSGIVYPFSNSPRFSMISQDRFVFLRGDMLEIYGNDGMKTKPCTSVQDIKLVLNEYLGSNFAFRKVGEKKSGV